MAFFVSDLLIGLVALAAKHDDIVLPGQVHGAEDGGLAGLDDFVGRLGFLHPGQDLPEDLIGVFCAGIIRGDDAEVGELRRDSAHDGALERVAVAAAAEDRDHAAAAEAAHGF